MANAVVTVIHQALRLTGGWVRVATIDRPNGDRMVELQVFAEDGFMTDRHVYHHRDRTQPIVFRCHLEDGDVYMFHETVQRMTDEDYKARNLPDASARLLAHFAASAGDGLTSRTAEHGPYVAQPYGVKRFSVIEGGKA
jgi:hypothetical protein